MTAAPSRSPRPVHTRPPRTPLPRAGITHAPTPAPAEPAPAPESNLRAIRHAPHLHATNLRGQIIIALLAAIYTATTRTGLRYAFDHVKSGVLVSIYTGLLFNLVSPGAPIPNTLLWLATYTILFLHFRREQNSVLDEYAAQHIRTRHEMLGDA